MRGTVIMTGVNMRPTLTPRSSGIPLALKTGRGKVEEVNDEEEKGAAEKFARS